jgi:hypothetical protein
VAVPRLDPVRQAIEIGLASRRSATRLADRCPEHHNSEIVCSVASTTEGGPVMESSQNGRATVAIRELSRGCRGAIQWSCRGGHVR